MSLPPSILQIKRKRGDDAPPDTLQLEHLHDEQENGAPQSKRRPALKAWVFQKVPQDDIKGDEAKPLSTQKPWENKIPVVKATQPGDERRGHGSKKKGMLGAKSTLDSNASSSIMPAASATSGSAIPRRFHLTRATKAITQSSMKTNGVRKTRAVATFMERHPNTIRALKNYESKQVSVSGGSQIESDNSMYEEWGNEIAAEVSTATPERALKKPGRNARMGRASQALAGSAKGGVGSQQLASEMQKFSLERMARELVEKNVEPIPAIPRDSVSLTKPIFKPKPQAQRYQERHAANKIPSNSSQPSGCNQGREEHTDTDDETDYVTHTYVRVPVHTLPIVPTDMGVLVIENDEQMQEFYEYGEDSDDDSDIFDDEIDENAENNPNNDYPDEEVDSDDEFDKNAYQYRNYASDEEEFDEANYSDDGNDLPWTEPAWGKQKKPAWEVDDEMSDS